MNIVLKIKLSQLTELIKAIHQGYNNNFDNTIASKANYYLFKSIFKKLLNKQLNKLDSPTKKPFKITLSYAEAANLYSNLQNLIISDTYTNAVITSITNNLHQQLISL